jgi:hypothetical protein
MSAMAVGDSHESARRKSFSPGRGRAPGDPIVFCIFSIKEDDYRVREISRNPVTDLSERDHERGAPIKVNPDRPD